MGRFLIMRGDTVVNVVVWDGESPWQPSADATVLDAPAGVGPGHRLVDGEWIAPPPPPEPEEFEQ